MDKEACIARILLLDEFLITCLTAGWLIRWMKGPEIQEALNERFELRAVVKNFDLMASSTSTPPEAGHGGDGSGRG